MSPNYILPPAYTIVEKPEDASRDEMVGTEAERETMYSRRQEYLHDSTMTSTRTSSDRQKDKPRKSHRSATSSSVSRNSNKVKAKGSSSRHGTRASRDEHSDSARHRNRQTRSHPSEESSYSSSEEEEAMEDHRVVLATAARGRLTSPSLVSTLTSLTTATNNSGSSSGSNSTVTQASLSKNLVPKQSDPMPEAPISPAVPDPPDVFAYLEQDSSDEEGDEAEEDEDNTPEATPEPRWLSDGIYDSSPLAHHHPLPANESMSSSGSSSFHSDEGSERLAGNETDRSTSPERSVKGEDDIARPDTATPTDPAASKLASQILAAQHRQSLHGAVQSVGTPRIPSKALSPRQPQHMKQHSLPRAEKIPITGYEALASKLSNHGTKSTGINPIYRRFERLNHRLLLHLQDELAELEEQLHRLDNADTQSRSLFGANPTDIRILPASRRAAAHAGGELEWHKMDLINKISFKLGQYNQVLSSFNAISQELDAPDPDAVKKYRYYLHSERPVMENEARFLDAAGDLVILGRKAPTPRKGEYTPEAPSLKSHDETEITSKSSLSNSRIIAIAIAAAVLIPILTFAVIPGFLGRMTVVMLVATGILGALVQSGAAGRDLLGTDWVYCIVIYGAVMVVIAGVHS